jgi:biopolymer transport protein ExbD
MLKYREKKRSERKRSEVFINITSLLDTIVVLLFFLLNCYNPSDMILHLVNDVSPPPSTSSDLGSHAVVIQVDKKMQLWVDNKLIVDKLPDDELITPLFNTLKEIKKINEEKLKAAPAAADSKLKTSNNVNLVFDQSLTYSTIRRVMHTSASAGFPEFKMIVQGGRI